ncbi:MAG TPA: hypothetical protein PK388_00745 [Kiritimatiellia bacterium]|nr:hypothetical protein [Kiritimatiellia bacterium]
MKATASRRPSAFLGVLLAACGGLALALFPCGCGDVEGTNVESAECTLAPAGDFSVAQDPPPEDEITATTNVVEGTTNVVTTVVPGDSVAHLSLTATEAGDATWSVQVADDAGHVYPGTAEGPALAEPGADDAYAVGATIATFAIECSGLAGELTAVAVARIPLEVVRTTATNGTATTVSRHGQHELTPQNAEFHLSVTAADGGYDLSGDAPVGAATIVW